MKRLIIAATALFVCAFAAPAYANANQFWVNASVAAAQSYWGNTIPQNGNCTAMPTINQVDLASAHGGLAYDDQCMIQMDGSENWTPYNFCVAIVHEWGHLTLGVTFFATENPADPAHSVETTGQYAVMQESSNIYNLDIPQCVNVQNEFDPPLPTQTSTAPINIQLHDVVHHHKRHHRQKHHRHAH